MKHFVVVAGNIGAGKSSLVAMLCQRLGWQPFHETAAENPYLADFYQDMQRWSFHSQIFFLANRLHAHRAIADHPTSAMQDRSVYEDAEIFARNLREQGHLSERDYATYFDMYTALLDFLPAPDLVLYLRANVPTLQERITRRGRDYERRIAPDYLAQLNRLYDAWIQGFRQCPILTIPADRLDFVAHDAHLDLIAGKMREKLEGREEVLFDV